MAAATNKDVYEV